MIKGILEKKESNSYGYSTVWVSKTRYGVDKKGTLQAEVGDLVEFEAFDKPGNDGRTWPTVKFVTFKKAAGGSPQGPAVAAPSSGSSYSKPASAVGRDSYWTDKAAEDAKRDPRIVYQSSYERAILFADLAIKVGAFEALGKAKPTAKLEVLQAFVSEQAERIMKAVYAAEVPGKTSTTSKQVDTKLPELESDLPEETESWS